MRVLIAMAAFLSALVRLFGGDQSATSYKTAEIYTELRAQILTLRAEQVGAKTDDPILAVVMETGYPEAVVTLVSVIDGAASLYFSNGGGIIGGGEHDRPNAASKKLVTTAAVYARKLTKTDQTPLPPVGSTRFYLVTPIGLLTAEAKEQDLRNNRHELSPLFHAAHELIGEIRLMDEQRRKKE